MTDDTPAEDDPATRLGRLMRAPETPDPEGTPLTALPHSAEIGMRLHSAKAGVAVLSVPYDARLVGDPDSGVMHGGVITALLDTACGTAVMVAEAGLRSTATLDLRIDYMRPATRGLTVRARAECYRLTRAIGFARAVAYHEDPADPVASAAGAFMIDRGDGEGAG
jgi:uncharacterized protein (TIGR00369 family)